MFIVGWGHGNHAFVKHALRERALRSPLPPSTLVPHYQRPWLTLESPHRDARHSTFGCIHGGGSDVSNPDAGHATGCFRLVTETTRTNARNLPTLLLNLPIAHTPREREREKTVRDLSINAPIYISCIMTLRRKKIYSLVFWKFH